MPLNNAEAEAEAETEAEVEAEADKLYLPWESTEFAEYLQFKISTYQRAE